MCMSDAYLLLLDTYVIFNTCSYYVLFFHSVMVLR